MTAAPGLIPAPMALRCPKCAAEMVTFERSGIHLEQCRECRGIYLDRGELERLVDAESGGAGWAGPRMNPPAPIPLPLATDPRTLERPIDARGYRAEWFADDDAHTRRARDNDRRRDDGESLAERRRSFLGG
jgi:Zn-finger nucleic acid-binding protein